MECGFVLVAKEPESPVSEEAPSLTNCCNFKIYIFFETISIRFTRICTPRVVGLHQRICATTRRPPSLFVSAENKNYDKMMTSTTSATAVSEASGLRLNTNLERYAPQLKLVYMWSFGRLQRRHLPLGQPMQQRGLARVVQPCSSRQTAVDSGSRPPYFVKKTPRIFVGFSGGYRGSQENSWRSRGDQSCSERLAFPRCPSPSQLLIFDLLSRCHSF